MIITLIIIIINYHYILGNWLVVAKPSWKIWVRQWEGLSPYILWKIYKIYLKPPTRQQKKTTNQHHEIPEKKKLRHREGGETDHGWRDGGQSGRHGLPKTQDTKMETSWRKWWVSNRKNPSSDMTVMTGSYDLYELYDLLWSVMICYDLLWSVMTYDLWHVMTCYDMLWHVMTCYDHLGI